MVKGDNAAVVFLILRFFLAGVFYLWYSWAARVRGEGSDQRHRQEREKQRPEDVHHVVHDVGKRTLQTDKDIFNH